MIFRLLWISNHRQTPHGQFEDLCWTSILENMPTHPGHWLLVAKTRTRTFQNMSVQLCGVHVPESGKPIAMKLARHYGVGHTKKVAWMYDTWRNRKRLTTMKIWLKSMRSSYVTSLARLRGKEGRWRTFALREVETRRMENITSDHIDFLPCGLEWPNGDRF